MAIPRHVKTFVLGTGSSAGWDSWQESSSCLKGGFSLSAEKVTVTMCPPFQSGFTRLLSQMPDSELNGKLVQSFSSHKRREALGNLYSG